MVAVIDQYLVPLSCVTYLFIWDKLTVLLVSLSFGTVLSVAIAGSQAINQEGLTISRERGIAIT